MRLLCAEDNPLNAEILEELLHMQGATCTIYSDGKQLVEAFDHVRPSDYDVILMDVQMPVMNGYEATRALRASDNPVGRTTFSRAWKRAWICTSPSRLTLRCWKRR